jgi:hypothetical protein
MSFHLLHLEYLLSSAMSPLSFTQLLLLTPLALSSAAILPRASQLESRSVKAFAAPAPQTVTDNYLTLTRSTKPSRSFERLSALQDNEFTNARFKLSNAAGPPSNALISALGGAEYLTEIVYGGQTVKVILDTGSSDTWLIQSGFKCTDANGNVQATASCGFGGTYNGSFGANKIPNVNFQISYGDGEFVTGDMGYEDVTIAGITVPHQEVSMA